MREFAICTAPRDEDIPYLHEWIEYHVLIGADHFSLLHMNGKEELPVARYGNLVEVRHVSTPRSGPEQPIYDILDAAMIESVAGKARWTAFTDIDEFILPLQGDSVPAILAEYEEYGALAVGWHLFGSSGLLTRPPLQTEAYLWRARESVHHRVPNAQWIKSIARTDRITGFVGTGTHSVRCQPPYFMVDENLDKVDKWHRDGRREQTKIALNHYVVRSKEELEAKRRHWAPIYWEGKEDHLMDRNEVRDERITRFVPAIKEAMARRAEQTGAGI